MYNWPCNSLNHVQWSPKTHFTLLAIVAVAGCFNIYVVCAVLIYNAERHTHTVHACATRSLYFIVFVGRQQHVGLKIDLSSEAESFIHNVPWSRLLSFILPKTYSVLYGFRDTVSDLHLAEHKWVKRKYNGEQSPLLTPPGAHGLLQSAPVLFNAHWARCQRAS